MRKIQSMKVKLAFFLISILKLKIGHPSKADTGGVLLGMFTQTSEYSTKHVGAPRRHRRSGFDSLRSLVTVLFRSIGHS